MRSDLERWNRYVDLIGPLLVVPSLLVVSATVDMLLDSDALLVPNGAVSTGDNTLGVLGRRVNVLEEGMVWLSSSLVVYIAIVVVPSAQHQ